MDTKTTLSIVVAIIIILVGAVLLTNKKEVAPEPMPIATEVPAGTTMPLNEITLAPEVAPASSTVTVTE